ncbi:MAG: RHS repeat-associated core domain-containing protein [Dehalococcoidia bacterium]|nr:RHS repeat-associated core domain-containing protein [Dehalococcoidia bacterium]
MSQNSKTVFQISQSGQVLDQGDVFGSCATSVAASGDDFWLFTAIFSPPSARHFQQYDLDGSYTGTLISVNRLYADGDFDRVTFAPLCAMWSTNVFETGFPSRIVAWEVPCQLSNYVEYHNGAPSFGASATSLDPVNLAFGNYTHQNTDINIQTVGPPLGFTRTYNSSRASIDGRLGFGWTDNFDMHLVFDGSDVIVVNADGREDRYLNSSGSYFGPPDIADVLTSAGGNYTLVSTVQMTYTFDSAGKLTQIVDRNSNTLTLAYFTSGPDLGKLQYVQEPGTDPDRRKLTFAYSGGRLSTITDTLPSPNTRTVAITYDGSGNLLTLTSLGGAITTFDYATPSNHLLTKITDANSRLIAKNCYDTSNRIYKQFGAPSSTPPAEPDCTLARTDPSVALYGIPITEFFYQTPAGGQTTLRDPRGYDTVYKFDNFFRVTRVQDPLGGVTQYQYDSHSSKTCVTDPLGQKTAFGYDAKGNLTQKVDALNTDANCALIQNGKVWTNTYNALNEILSETDPLNRYTQYIYDSSTTGNLTRTVRKDAQNGTVKALTCATFNSAGQPIASVESTDLIVPPGPTDPCTGNKTIFEYNDAYKNLTGVVNPRFSGSGSPKTTFTSDAAGRVTSKTDELGHTSSYVYDAQNNVTKVLNPLRQVAGVSAESGLQCGTSGTGNGVNDDPGDDTVADDGCPSTINTYDAKGNLKTVTDANGKTTQYNYDPGDHLVQVVDALNKSTTYAYDANGNRISITDANRQAFGTSEASIANACGSGTGNGVDNDSPLDGVIDDGCPSTLNVYDALNRLQSTTDALGRTTTYQPYDSASNLTQRTDALGRVTKYITYDKLNHLTQLEHWNAGATTRVDSVDYTYDDVGNRKSMVEKTYDSSANTLSTRETDYTYDALNRLSCTWAGPATPVCPSGSVSYQYDSTSGPGAPYPGQRTKINYPDGKIVSYTYNADGSMATVTDWLNKITSYSYYDDGTLLTTTYTGSVGSVSYQYDAARQVTDVTHNPGNFYTEDFIYNTDAAGYRTQMTRTGRAPETYQYDDLYHLKRVDYADSTFAQYSYDAVGNRTQQVSGGTTQYTYDAANQLTLAGSTPYTYDANGNLTARGNEAYVYDGENRLDRIRFNGFDPASTLPPPATSPCYDLNDDGRVGLNDVLMFIPVYNATGPNPPYNPFFDFNNDNRINLTDILQYIPQFNQTCPRYFKYNADGLRMSQKTGKFVTNYTWDVGSGLPLVLQEKRAQILQDDGTIFTTGSVVSPTPVTYVYGLGLISATDAAGNQRYYFPDGLGSTITTVNRATRQVVGQYEYDVFGNLRVGSATGEPFLFTGQQFDNKARDTQSGLYYLRNRWYDPTIGRFLTQDPLPGSALSPQSQNRYAYVQNNPVNRVDPTGLDSEGGGGCNVAKAVTGGLLVGLGLLIEVPGLIALFSPGTQFAGLVLLEVVGLPVLIGGVVVIADSGCVD